MKEKKASLKKIKNGFEIFIGIGNLIAAISLIFVTISIQQYQNILYKNETTAHFNVTKAYVGDIYYSAKESKVNVPVYYVHHLNGVYYYSRSYSVSFLPIYIGDDVLRNVIFVPIFIYWEDDYNPQYEIREKAPYPAINTLIGWDLSDLYELINKNLYYNNDTVKYFKLGYPINFIVIRYQDVFEDYRTIYFSDKGKLNSTDEKKLLEYNNLNINPFPYSFDYNENLIHYINLIIDDHCDSSCGNLINRYEDYFYWFY